MTDAPKPQTLFHEIRDISPSEAVEYLKKSRNPGTIDQRQVATYASDIAQGRWKLNGDPVIFGRDGSLLSGRLRLQACVKANHPFPSLIVGNVDPGHFDTIDALRRRRVADIMSIRKEESGRSLAAALTVLWRFGNGDFESQSKKISAQALVSILEENPDIRYSLRVAKVAVPRVPHGLGAALHFMFAAVDASKADGFFNDLGSRDLDGRSPTALLKRQLVGGLGEGGRRNQVQLAGLIIKAWEAYRFGRPISLIRYVPDHDQFPKITGSPSYARFDGVKHSAAKDVREANDRGVNQQLSVRVEEITPARALEILNNNDRNRSIAANVVDKYARDMAAGSWALNGQTIKIGASGRLLDGQHRCAAAIRANTSFPAIVVEGLDDDVFDTFDLGVRRSMSALLKDRGETNTAVTAAVLRHVWLLQNGLVTLRNVSPTVNELMETLEQNPSIRDSVKLSNQIRDVAPSVILALHYFFQGADKPRADEFIARVGDGVMLGPDSPILKLREVLLEDRANKKRRLSDAEKAALIIKAWNAFYEDRPVRILKWANQGDRREAFPAIVGAADLPTAA